MKHLLILAAPLALVACGPGTTKAGSGDTMPAPTPITQGEKSAQAEKKPEMQVTELEGEWSAADSVGNKRAVYTSADGAVAVSLTCQQPDAFDGEGATNVLILRRAFAGNDAPSTLGILTSAGNGVVTVALDQQTNELSGTFDTRSQPANALANGEGDLRLVAGQSEYVLPTDPMVETLIETCRPPIETNVEPATEGEPDSEESPQTEG